MDQEYRSLPSQIWLLYLTGVGSKNFVKPVKTLLGALARGRKVRQAAEAYQLRVGSLQFSITAILGAKTAI